jgi:hypothetical protein
MREATLCRETAAVVGGAFAATGVGVGVCHRRRDIFPNEGLKRSAINKGSIFVSYKKWILSVI